MKKILSSKRKRDTRNAGEGAASRGTPISRQLAALGCRRYLIRLQDLRRRSTENVYRMRDELSPQEIQEWSAAHDVHLAPATPNGLVVVPHLVRQKVQQLVDAGLTPCCVVRYGPRMDVWVRLAEPHSIDPQVLTAAAKLVAGRANADPLGAHWQRGGYAADSWVHLYGTRARLTEAKEVIAPAGEALLEDAARRVERIRDGLAALADLGGDPAWEAYALSSPSMSEEEAKRIYARQASIARAWGVTDPAEIDLSVARAAMKAGAAVERVRRLIRVGSPGLRDRVAHIPAYIDELVRSVITDQDVSSTLTVREKRLAQVRAVVDAAFESVQQSLLLDEDRGR